MFIVNVNVACQDNLFVITGSGLTYLFRKVVSPLSGRGQGSVYRARSIDLLCGGYNSIQMLSTFSVSRSNRRLYLYKFDLYNMTPPPDFPILSFLSKSKPSMCNNESSTKSFKNVSHIPRMLTV